MKTIFKLLLVTCLLFSVQVKGLHEKPVLRTAKSYNKQRAGDNKPGKWVVLFDGKDLSKWRKASVDSVPSPGWVIENNTLSVVKGRKGGDIITRETYGNFELEWAFNLTPGANSGIKYLVNPIKNAKTGQSSPMGVEFQIIDDLHYPETKADPEGVSSTGSVYLIFAPKGKKLNPAGEWNQCRILVTGKHTEHWLNGVKVAEYERGSADFAARVALTKFKDYPDYAKSETGHIMLTDHGDRVYFKNIRIRKL